MGCILTLRNAEFANGASPEIMDRSYRLQEEFLMKKKSDAVKSLKPRLVWFEPLESRELLSV